MKEFFKHSNSFEQLVTLLVMIVIFFIIASGVMVIATLSGTDITAPRFLLVFQAITQILTFLLPAIIFGYLFSYDLIHSRRSIYGGNCIPIVAKKTFEFAVAIVMLICLVPFSDWLSQVNDNWHWGGALQALEQKLRQMSESTEQMMKQMMAMNSIGDLILNIFVIALVASVCEEFLFRGALQQWFGRWIRCHHIAIICAAAVFSLAHAEIFAFLPRFMLGIFLGYLFHYAGSIWVNITAHFLNNALVVVLYYLYINGTISTDITDTLGAPWYVTLIGLVFAVTIFYFTFLRGKRKKTTAEKEDIATVDL